MWVPFAKEIVPVVDVEGGKVLICPPEGLLELNAGQGQTEKKKKKKEVELMRAGQKDSEVSVSLGWRAAGKEARVCLGHRHSVHGS